jgi:microcystin-dependent protein
MKHKRTLLALALAFTLAVPLASDPFVGEIRVTAFNFPPKYWALCNGQLLFINQNQALFSLLGTTYGGDGRTTFALPNLQGRMPIHMGNGHTLGQRAGEQYHTINYQEMPGHIHTLLASPISGLKLTQARATSATASAGMNWGTVVDARGNSVMVYVDGGADSYLAPWTENQSGNIGGNQPHENMPPYLVLNYIIALSGVFPSQD